MFTIWKERAQRSKKENQLNPWKTKSLQMTCSFAGEAVCSCVYACVSERKREREPPLPDYSLSLSLREYLTTFAREKQPLSAVAARGFQQFELCTATHTPIPLSKSCTYIAVLLALITYSRHSCRVNFRFVSLFERIISKWFQRFLIIILRRIAY